MATRAIDFACRLVAAELSDNEVAAVTPLQRAIMLHVCAGLHEPVHIAETMDRNAAPVTNMCRHMAEDGFLEVQPAAFEAYRLAPAGAAYVERLMLLAEGRQRLNFNA